MKETKVTGKLELVDKEFKVTGRIEFCDKEYQEFDRTFEATLKESAAFSYGNNTVVIIEWGEMANGEMPESKLIDTRSDYTLKRDGSNFKEWLIDYFQENYASHTLTISQFQGEER